MIKKSCLILAAILLWGCSQKEHLHTEFLSKACIMPFKGYRYLTCDDMYFKIEGNEYFIPKGFDTDLASIPRIIWPVMAPSHSSFMRSSIVHDWFYRKTCDFDRKQTDLIFYHMLKNDEVSEFKASLMFYTVRAFGARFYNEDYCHE